MPLYDREQARKGGFAQVREALQSFEGDVVRAEDGEWGGQRFDNDGNPLPKREYFEVECINNVPLEVTEELTMDITESFSFRVNMSEWDGSFWVDEFLASADKVKILLPDGLIGKRVVWKKVIKTWDIKGEVITYANFIIAEVKKAQGPAPRVVPKTAQAPATIAAPAKVEVPAEEAEVEASTPAVDPMEVAMELAVGKTEAQFRMAIGLNPAFAGSPLLSLAKSGAITQSLVNDGKLTLVKEGNKEVYQKVE